MDPLLLPEHFGYRKKPGNKIHLLTFVQLQRFSDTKTAADAPVYVFQDGRDPKKNFVCSLQ